MYDAVVESRQVVPIYYQQSLTKSCRSSGEHTQAVARPPKRKGNQLLPRKGLQNRKLTHQQQDQSLNSALLGRYGCFLWSTANVGQQCLQQTGIGNPAVEPMPSFLPFLLNPHAQITYLDTLNLTPGKCLSFPGQSKLVN